MKKILLATGLLATVTFFGLSGKAEAATLNFNDDLKGYEATISTVNGENVLKTKKGTWELNENTQIYSSKNIIINLENTVPVKIDAIYTKKNLDFRGTGELTAETAGQYGINVGGYLKAFKKAGDGKVVGKGTEAGIRAYNEIQMEGGELEGYGVNYGVWSYNDIKPKYTASIKAYASSTNGIGIWAYRDIYAWKGASVYGEGGASGAYTQIAHIQAQDGSTIKGVSRNIDSNLSALHAQKQMPRAYSNAKVIEEYVLNEDMFGDFDTELDTFNILEYNSINRNMLKTSNYIWSITNGEGEVSVLNEGLKLSNDLDTSTITGVRSNQNENKTQLKTNGSHTVIFSNVTTLGEF